MIYPLLFTLAASPQCLDGYYDLGAATPAIAFACMTDESGNNIGANIRFCDREELLGAGTCNGREDIPCAWYADPQAWLCHANHFDALIHSTGDDTITYQFKSGDDSGDLAGKRLPFSPL